MFSQEKTGKFIAECRKERGLTQRQLAERLSISDKTVSKWETGNGMPDTSIMEELCAALSINVNELLSGERLTDVSYNGKAEENMKELMKEKEAQKKGAWVGTVIAVVGGFILCAMFLLAAAGPNLFINFIDMPSVILILGVLLVALGLSGQYGNFCAAFSFAFGRKRNSGEELKSEREAAAYAMRLAGRLSMLAGIFGLVDGIVAIMHYLDDPSQIGPNLAVAVLTVFYGALFAMVFAVIEGRVKR